MYPFSVNSKNCGTAPMSMHVCRNAVSTFELIFTQYELACTLVLILKRPLDDVHTWNFIPGRNHPWVWWMSLTVYTFLPRWNFSSLSKRRKFHRGMKKRTKKTCKHCIPIWNFKMSMYFFNFWRIYSNMLSNVNVFQHNESVNIMKRKASL